ncbi:MAG: hypothetical protein QFC55_05355 [Chloroflexota bacterium]|nr:hypothetical protein [Chloroflexota bacterium]
MSSTTFDIPTWIAEISGLGREELAYESQAERAGHLITHYQRGGKPFATVDLVAVSMGGRRGGQWQLVVHVGAQVSAAQLPTSTRFGWR